MWTNTAKRGLIWIGLALLLGTGGCRSPSGWGSYGDFDNTPDSDTDPSDLTLADGPVGDTGICGQSGDFDLPNPEGLRLGAVNTFEIATWNLHNFPKAESSADKVAELVKQMDLDLVVVEEISDTAAFERVLAQLPEFSGTLSPHTYYDGSYQKIGFLYRQDELILKSSTMLFLDDDYNFPRPALQASFSSLRWDCSWQDFILIGVHLKANLDSESISRRRAAIERLKVYTDDLLENGAVKQVFLLGDFNDELDDALSSNVFTPYINDASDYSILTQPLVGQSEMFSYIPFESLIDHIIVTKEVLENYIGPKSRTLSLALEELLTAYDYESEVSDHRPVISVFER